MAKPVVLRAKVSHVTQYTSGNRVAFIPEFRDEDFVIGLCCSSPKESPYMAIYASELQPGDVVEITLTRMTPKDTDNA